jgi:predicted dehydrogenase
VNIVVIGLGSMGKRRIRLMRELYPKMTIYGVDRRNDRRKETEAIFGIESFASIEAINKDVDCAFVCTSPLSHSSIIRECLTRKWHTFTELNLVADGYCENMELAKKNSCHLFLSSTFYYREEIKYIQSQVQVGEKWNYMYHIGQYLPDWHPWENYSDFFVGDKRTNGCREIFAIELPWLTGAFGGIKEIHTISGKMSGLNIAYDDNFLVQLIHENGCKGILAVDVVSPYAARRFEAYTEGKYMIWNGTPDSLTIYDAQTQSLIPVVLTEETEHREGYAGFVVENAYKNEIKEFFAVVRQEKTPIYGFEQDREILELINRIGA